MLGCNLDAPPLRSPPHLSLSNRGHLAPNGTCVFFNVNEFFANVGWASLFSAFGDHRLEAKR